MGMALITPLPSSASIILDLNIDVCKGFYYYDFRIVSKND